MFHSFDYIINCGGYGAHYDYNNGGEKIAKTHIFGLINILKLLNKKRIKKFIQIGSSEEYGQSTSPINENKKAEPLTPYAFAKKICTNLLKSLYISEKFPSVTLRIFLAYGPYQDNNRLIPQVINGFIKNRQVKLSSGYQKKDFCFIEDIVDAILLLINSKKATNGEIFNVCSGSSISIKKIVYKIKNIIKKGKPKFGKIKIRSSENLNFYGDNKKIKKNLGWKPKTTLKNGLQKTIKYYLKNE